MMFVEFGQQKKWGGAAAPAPCMAPCLQALIVFVVADGRELFAEFLRGEFSDENLEFWLACERYRLADDDDQLPSIAQQIYHDYVAPNAPRQVPHRVELKKKILLRTHLCLYGFRHMVPTSVSELCNSVTL